MMVIMVDINRIGVIIQVIIVRVIPTGLGDGLGHGIIGVIGVAGGGKSIQRILLWASCLSQ